VNWIDLLPASLLHRPSSLRRGPRRRVTRWHDRIARSIPCRELFREVVQYGAGRRRSPWPRAMRRNWYPSVKHIGIERTPDSRKRYQVPPLVSRLPELQSPWSVGLQVIGGADSREPRAPTIKTSTCSMPGLCAGGPTFSAGAYRPSAMPIIAILQSVLSESYISPRSRQRWRMPKTSPLMGFQLDYNVANAPWRSMTMTEWKSTGIPE